MKQKQLQHPGSSLIDILSDQRQREHHTRNSILIDDVDLILHERATRRSIVYGGASQGLAFWNRIKSAVNRTPSSTPSSSSGPTASRNVQTTLTNDQEQAILKSAPNIVVDADDELNKTATTAAMDSTISSASGHRSSSSTTRSSGSSSSSRGGGRHFFYSPFQSMWDRLDMLSYQERQRKDAYHNTVQEQNKIISPTTDPESINATPTLASYREQRWQKHEQWSGTGGGGATPTISTSNRKTPSPGGAVEQDTSTSSTTNNVVAPPTTMVEGVAGRLRRQHSWNGRDSARDILQARGSILATVEDGLFQDLSFSKITTDPAELQHQKNGGQEENQNNNNNENTTMNPATVEKSFFTNTSKNEARKKAEESVLNLIM